MILDRTSPEFLCAARGDGPCDLVIEGAQVVNVFTRSLVAATVCIHGGRFAAILPAGSEVNANQRIDAQGRMLLPGFIDAHMHIESMMLPPTGCAQVVIPHGTTGIVADPHEIANVCGIPGIRWMMNDAQFAMMNVWFAASSCVPASALETAGAEIDAAQLTPLFDDARVIALAEMMNFPGTIAGDPELMKKIALGLARRGRVDGHAPGLRGRALQAYVAAGPSSDHECFTGAEAMEKLASGQRVFIREGSAARNLAALVPVVTQANAHRFCFCTDDVEAWEGLTDGHLDRVIRRAAGLGLDGPTAIAMASLHVADHYGLHDYGAIAAGRVADFSLAHTPNGDWSKLTIESTFVRGELAAQGGKCVREIATIPVADFLTSSVRLPASLSEESFIVRGKTNVPARVVGIIPSQIITESLREMPLVVDGRIQADPSRDLLILASIERHKASGSIGVGLVKGLGMRSGAIASTVGHDAHNLSVAGCNPHDMLVAARRLEAIGGGQCIVDSGRVVAELPLAIGGLLSDQPPEIVSECQHRMLSAYKALGGQLIDPFMQLAFLPLSVIPHLKLSNCGIIDVDKFAIVPLQDP